jgi:hypothetical protein
MHIARQYIGDPQRDPGRVEQVVRRDRPVGGRCRGRRAGRLGAVRGAGGGVHVPARVRPDQKTGTPGSAAVMEGHLVAVGVGERESAAERPVDGR